MKRTLLAAALPLALFAGPAFAQQSAVLVEVEDDARMVEAYGVSVGQLDDMDIYSAAGEEIGEVDEVLMDGDGNIVALVAEVGGFLGIGDKEVVLQLDQVQMRGDRLTVDMTEEQLEQLPEWKD
ncbi:MAG: PRC-barrel domain-containing protein [Tistlia sp.]|uniref:PRC-barrel domain-containing protein n=1 Tax=Tistlia sp. TaxID=3057121 RepID=UPI0034A44C7B